MVNVIRKVPVEFFGYSKKGTHAPHVTADKFPMILVFLQTQKTSNYNSRQTITETLFQ